MTSAMLVATAVGCYAIAGLAPPHSPKLGLTNLKIEVRSTIFNIDTGSRACMRMATEAVWVGGAHVQATYTRVDGGGGLRWPEPMVNVACMHVWSPCRALMLVVVLYRQTL
jgi:hypothetical protein